GGGGGRIGDVAEFGFDRSGRAGGEDRCLQQGVRGQTGRPVHSGARDLTDGVEPSDAGAPNEVGGDAAHEVMGGRGDGNEIVGGVQPVGGKSASDAGEPV